MLMELGIYELDIDPERTAAFYRDTGGIDCDCPGCRNYAEAVAHMPLPGLELLRKLGIDPAKPADISTNYAPTPDSIHYHVYYHVCGVSRAERSPWIRIGKKHYAFDESCRIHLAADCDLYVVDNMIMALEDLPRPAIQIEMTVVLPWMLPEGNPFFY